MSVCVRIFLPFGGTAKSQAYSLWSWRIFCSNSSLASSARLLSSVNLTNHEGISALCFFGLLFLGVCFVEVDCCCTVEVAESVVGAEADGTVATTCSSMAVLLLLLQPAPTSTPIGTVAGHSAKMSCSKSKYIHFFLPLHLTCGGGPVCWGI